MGHGVSCETCRELRDMEGAAGHGGNYRTWRELQDMERDEGHGGRELRNMEKRINSTALKKQKSSS